MVRVYWGILRIVALTHACLGCGVSHPKCFNIFTAEETAKGKNK